MKKMLVLLIGIILLCTSCTDLPANTREVVNGSGEVQFVESELETQRPYGNYILVRYYPTGAIAQQQILVDLFLNNQVVCNWDLGNVQPWDREEDTLYFTPDEDNCPSLDIRNGVSWYVRDNNADLLFQEEGSINQVIGQLEIWSLINGKYSRLERK